jgi:hypothetical protein
VALLGQRDLHVAIGGQIAPNANVRLLPFLTLTVRASEPKRTSWNVPVHVSLFGRNQVEGEESEANRLFVRGNRCAFGLRYNASGTCDANLS